MLFKEKRFDLRWLGEIREGGTEDFGHTIASSKTLSGIRKYANLKKITDDDSFSIEEIGYELIEGLKIETIVAENKIKITKTE